MSAHLIDVDLFLARLKSNADFEVACRDGLQSLGVDDEIIELVIRRVRPIMAKLPSFTIPSAIPEAAREGIRLMQVGTSEVFGHLVLAIAEAEINSRIIRDKESDDE